MEHLLAQHAMYYRLGCFFGILLLMMLLEILVPRRDLTQSKVKRWGNNLGMVILNSVLERLLLPGFLVAMALLAQSQQWGILHYVSISQEVAFIIGIIVLDFAIYLQHVMFHALPLFWRFHRMHHLDMDVDVTTGLRFHPLEIFLSLLIKAGVVLLVGIGPWAIVVFEILLNATSLFNHSNLKLPLGFDKILRWFIVTPDMHRVHHSIVVQETNSNFGFNFSCWDRLLGTYRAQPREGHLQMSLGIQEIRDQQHCVNLIGMLTSPLLPTTTTLLQQDKYQGD